MYPLRSHLRAAAASAGVLGLLASGSALAASSWNPTFLVNTESFQTIDEGDGTTDVEIRFGQTLDERLSFNRSASRFQFSDDLHVGGNLSASGTLSVDGAVNTKDNLTINSDNGATDAVLIFGNDAGTEALRFSDTSNAFELSDDLKVRGSLSGSSLFTDGSAEIRGSLAASGSVRTDGDLTINDDRTAADAVLTFGNATTNQTITYSNANQRFQFSDDLKVNGNLSGSTLTVDGTITIRGQTYSFPDSQGAADTFLKTDGSNNLSWSAITNGTSSGGILALSPEYPNAVYFASGSTTVGTLAMAYDATNKENYYRWTSTKTAVHDYWVAVRVRIPDNFDRWDPTAPIQLRYRSGSATNTINYATVRLLDTGGSNVALTGNANLAGTSWTTASITGPQSAGTYTPGSYITVLIKIATRDTGTMDIGFLNFKWSTTTP